MRQLSERFLKDPTVRQMRWLPDLEQLLGAWADDYGADRVQFFGQFQMAAFRDKLIDQNLSPARVNRYLAALRRLWRWGLTKGYILASQPWPLGLFLKEPDEKEVIATGEEVAGMFEACDAVSAELGSLVRFLVGTGARLSDALAETAGSRSAALTWSISKATTPR